MLFATAIQYPARNITPTSPPCWHTLQSVLCKRTRKVLPETHRTKLTSVSLALSQTPVYTARPRIAQHACLRPSFRRYSLRLPTKGRPGWVDLGRSVLSRKQSWKWSEWSRTSWAMKILQAFKHASISTTPASFSYKQTDISRAGIYDMTTYEIPAPLCKCYNRRWRIKVKKVKVCIALYGLETHHRATERHLPYGITQCYLPPYTGERAPP